MSLKSLLLSCLSSFNDLINDVDAPQYSYESEVPAASWIDELGRLRIWAGNVGAHQTGPSSLDFRLRDASHIQDEVTKLLKDLERLLEEAQEYIYEEDHEDESLCGSDSLDEDPVTELQALFGELTTIIQCLYKLAMLIRNPAQHDFLAESYRTETAAFEPYDQQHVRGKFPQAEQVLILRLARALTRRRGYLKYRERHSRKLAKGLEDPQTISSGDGATISETMASDVQSQPVDYNDTPSESGISQTSYAESLLRGGVITLPAQPKDSTLGNPFVCPYCHFIITIKTTQSWPRHVFTDLKPYICTFLPCRTPDKLYSSRREWFAHIRSTHDTTTLLCPLCRLAVDTTQKYERHIARHLEELALFVLPRGGDSDEEEQEEDEEKEEDAGTPNLSATNTEARPEIILKRTYPCDVCGEQFSEDDLSRHVATHGSFNPFTRTKKKAEPLPSPEKEDDEARKTGMSGNTLQGKFGDKTLESSDFDALSSQQINTGSPQENLSAEEKKPTIRFIDWNGIEYTFPWHLCCTWDGMEYLIRYAFSHVESVGMEVKAGRYNLVGPDNKIILPQAWESSVKPGWVIRMHLWRTPEDLQINQTSSPTSSPEDTVPDPFLPELPELESPGLSFRLSELSRREGPEPPAELPAGLPAELPAGLPVSDRNIVPELPELASGGSGHELPSSVRPQSYRKNSIDSDTITPQDRASVRQRIHSRKGSDDTIATPSAPAHQRPPFSPWNDVRPTATYGKYSDDDDPSGGDISSLSSPHHGEPGARRAPVRLNLSSHDTIQSRMDPIGGNIASLSSPHHGEPYAPRSNSFRHAQGAPLPLASPPLGSQSSPSISALNSPTFPYSNQRLTDNRPLTPIYLGVSSTSAEIEPLMNENQQHGSENFTSDQGALSGEELEKQTGDKVLRSMMRDNDEDGEVEEEKEGSGTVPFSTTDSEARTEVLPGPEPPHIQSQPVNEAVGNAFQPDVPPELIDQITQNVLNRLKASGIESSATPVPNPSKTKYPLPPPTLRCQGCAAEFLYPDDLSRHIATHDGSNRPTQTFAKLDPIPSSEKEHDPIATTFTTNDIWTCCKCGCTNTLALCPEDCPLCPHRMCSDCKIGKPTGL